MAKRKKNSTSGESKDRQDSKAPEISFQVATSFPGVNYPKLWSHI